MSVETEEKEEPKTIEELINLSVSNNLNVFRYDHDEWVLDSPEKRVLALRIISKAVKIYKEITELNELENKARVASEEFANTGKWERAYQAATVSNLFRVQREWQIIVLRSIGADPAYEHFYEESEIENNFNNLERLPALSLFKRKSGEESDSEWDRLRDLYYGDELYR